MTISDLCDVFNRVSGGGFIFNITNIQIMISTINNTNQYFKTRKIPITFKNNDAILNNNHFKNVLQISKADAYRPKCYSILKINHTSTCGKCQFDRLVDSINKGYILI